MTPKEKAKKLLGKYLFYFPINRDDSYYDLEYDFDEEKAKQCALIAVNEIISIKPNNPFIVNGYYIEPKKYWQQVKQEIEKL